MRFPYISILLAFTLLSGCVSATPDRVLSTEPQGEVQNTGQFPIIGREPVGQTAQMTPTQKAEMQAELARDAEIAKRQAQRNSQSSYINEVNRLKKLAQDRIESLTNRIEGGGGGGDNGNSDDNDGEGANGSGDS